MALFHTQLALEYFERGHAPAQWTPALLAEIVAGVCRTYALTTEGTEAVQAEARALATVRGLLPRETKERL